MKRFSILILSITLFISSNACEICGCGVGNYYIGLLPHFSHRFVGVRYHFNSFRTRLKEDPSEFSRDFFQTAEIWGGWNIGQRFQVLAFVPYNFNHQVSDDGTTNLNGLGDVAALVNYKLVDKATTNGSHQWWIGAGVKLPTGRFDIEDGDPDLAAIANTQRGSGSTDILLHSMYTLRKGSWGSTTAATFKLNTSNSDEYKFGNKLSVSSHVFHASQAGKTTISPNLGLLYEHTGPSSLQKEEVDLTGGSLLLGSAGLELGFHSIAIGFNTQLPISQRFAEGQTKSKIRGMLHFSFSI